MAMRQPARNSGVVALFLSCLCFCNAQYTVRRNSQDCIYPTVAFSAERLWPTSAYLPRGNSIKRIDSPEGYLVRLLVAAAAAHCRSRSICCFGTHFRTAHPQVDSTAGFSIEYYSTYKVRWLRSVCVYCSPRLSVTAAAAVAASALTTAAVYSWLTDVSGVRCYVLQIITNKLINEKYLVYNCGTGRPAPPAGITKVFEGPLTSASVADATAADFLVRFACCSMHT